MSIQLDLGDSQYGLRHQKVEELTKKILGWPER